MDNFSRYRPDRSLVHAVALLLGGCGVVAGGIYVLFLVEPPLVRWHQAHVAEIRAEQQAVTSRRMDRAAQRPPRRPAGSGLPRAGGASVFAGGGVPVWAGSGGRPAPSTRSAPPVADYGVEPDFGHARLDGPSSAGGGAPAASGAAVAEANGPTGGAPSASVASPTVDLGSSALAAQNSGGWQSEASTLNRRVRALDGAIASLNRSNNTTGSSANTQPSGTASTASASRGSRSSSSGPGVPDEPNQVPLGGAEWLAAAGAAYAMNRLRKNGEDEEDGASDDDMP